MLRSLCCVYLVLLSFLQAADLGVHGALFPIRERSILEIIYNRLNGLEKSGKLMNLQRVFAQKAQERVKRPLAIAKLPRTDDYRFHPYNPEITARQDYKDHQGKTFYRKNQKINPLDIYSWGVPIILISGDDEDQISWAFKQSGKIVLTQGTPLELEKEFKRPVYFDQAGLIVKRFKITALPAKISQKDKQLLVEMIPLRAGMKGKTPK